MPIKEKMACLLYRLGFLVPESFCNASRLAYDVGWGFTRKKVLGPSLQRSKTC